MFALFDTHVPRKESENSTSDISRGIFAATVGTQRMLKMFDKYNIKATWFIPGHTLDSFPTEMAAVRDAGHEIGLHGYSHENPADMTLNQQRIILDKTYRQLSEFCGKWPKGSVAPWWEASAEGAQLLLDYGIQYDHSLSHHDCQAYYLRTGDSWTKIDYNKHPNEWMKPLVNGKETGLVEIPANWYIDDLPPMMFIKAAPNSHGYVNPRDVEDIWRDTFDYCYREYDEFIFPSTCHPILIEHFMKHEGVEFVTMGYISDDFKKRNCPMAGAVMPAPAGSVLRESPIQ
ncbi:carbohydrate esterase family 4 protein [Trichoderma compactum]